MNQPNPLPRFDPKKVLWILATGSVILAALLVWVSFAQPLSTVGLDWNFVASSALNLIASLGAATAGILVTRQFSTDENPHRIWLSFTLGLWCWVAGQAYVFLFDITGLPYPEGLGVTDLLWVSGYIFLGLSLYFQLSLVYSKRKGWNLYLYLALVAIALLAAAALTNLAVRSGLGEGTHWFALFVTVIYPVFDLAEGSAAVWLSLLFGRGQWSRPWWGVIMFTLSDAIDTFYWMGGYDKIPLLAQNALDFVSSFVSFAGYVVIGLGLLANYYILRYGHASGLVKNNNAITPPTITPTNP
jgi:hypothetical protein